MSHTLRLAARRVVLLWTLWLVLPGWAVAAEPAKNTPATLPHELPADSVTHHQLKLGDRTINYTATAGTLPLTDEKGEVEARIFYVAFTEDGVADEARRPITYAFNGGPGAASAYLNIGAIGPRGLAFGPNGTLPPRVDHVVDNPDTWLPFTDLVFIDPVGTGYSRATGGSAQAEKKFWGVRDDLDALARIIRLHLTRVGRLTSPIYLAGESYGGFRAARLAHQLATQEGVAPTGALLISPALDFALMGNNPLDLLPWALRLPSYAAVALARQNHLSVANLAEAEHYALGPYLTALASGPDDPKQAQELYATVARLTGLDEATVARWHGRIPVGAYVKDLPGHNERVLSRYDGTIVAPDPNPRSFYDEEDPILDGSIPPFTRAFVSYVRDELGFKTDLAYQLLNRDVSRHWRWREGNSPENSIGSTNTLRQALALNPKLHVFIAQGLTDLVTPYMMSRYVIAHMPSYAARRIELKLYDGGHMMYLYSGSRHRLHEDAMAFYEGATDE